MPFSYHPGAPLFSATPFALQNSAHSAALFRQAVSSLVPAGGGLVSTGDLAVTQTGTPSMNVSIGVGRCWIPGTNVGNVTGGNFSSQAMYYGQNEAAYTAAVTTADSINPRIDVVYAAVQDSQYAGTLNGGVLAVVAGVPTSGASYPANAPAVPANAVALAWINVPANATSIVNANITPIAPPLPVGGKPYGQIATAAYSSDTGDIAYNFLAIIADVTTPSIPAGRKLRITLETDGYMTASSGITAIGLKQGGTTGNDDGTQLRNCAVSYQSTGSTESSDLTYHYTTTAAGPQRFYATSKAVLPSGAAVHYPTNARRITVFDDGAA